MSEVRGARNDGAPVDSGNAIVILRRGMRAYTVSERRRSTVRAGSRARGESRRARATRATRIAMHARGSPRTRLATHARGSHARTRIATRARESPRAHADRHARGSPRAHAHVPARTRIATRAAHVPVRSPGAARARRAPAACAGRSRWRAVEARATQRLVIGGRAPCRADASAPAKAPVPWRNLSGSRGKVTDARTRHDHEQLCWVDGSTGAAGEGSLVAECERKDPSR